MKKFITLLMCMLIFITLLTSCQKEVKQLSRPKKGDTVAEIVVKDYGIIYAKLFADAAPKAVENFTTHAKEGYYDGVSFYHIFENSILETGDPTETGSGGESIWGEDFEDEFSPELQPYCGALCMNNTGPDTNGSRFFIVQTNRKYDAEVLDQIENSYNIEFSKAARKNYKAVGGTPWFYRLNTVFGQVYQGYGVLNRIARVNKKNRELGIPENEVMIETINIVEYR